MKLICERDALRAALSHVASRARNKMKIPILEHVLLDAAGPKKLSLTATDLETRCVATCGAEIADAGSTTVSADRMSKLVEGMPPGAQVLLQLKGNDLHIECGRSRYKLPTLPAVDFPEMSAVTQATEVSLTGDEAKRLFSDPAGALPANDSRMYFFGGYLSQTKQGQIMVTGCDGIRLVRVTLDNDAKLDRGYLVPKPTMPELVKLAAKGELVLRINSNLIEATSGNVVFTSRLIDAEYPDTDRVIPAIASNFIEVDRTEFMAAFKRLIGIEDENSTVNISWKTGAEAIEMALAGDGSGSESVACKCDLDDGEISFKPNVLGGMLDVPNGKVLQFHIKGANDPMRIVDPADEGLTVVAMPCRGRG